MRIRKALSICALFVLPIFILMGCTAHRTYPWEKASLWVCEDPYFEVNFAGGATKSYFEWEGRKYEVFVRFGYGKTVTVFLASDDGVLMSEDILLGGSWKYRGKNMVVKLDGDDIFGGAYKELVFVPQK